MELFSIATLMRVWEGILALLQVSAISIIFSVIFGLILGRCMVTNPYLKSPISRAISSFLRIFSKAFLEIIRIIPLIAWLFIVYYGIAAAFNLHISSNLCAIIVFSAWGAAEMSDIVRSSILSVPRHQRESSLALGFSSLQIELFIILPQALIHILPSSVNLIGRIIKTTSLLPLIGVVEILKVGQQLIEVFSKSDANISFIVYGLILLIYFCLCYPFAYLAMILDKKARKFY